MANIDVKYEAWKNKLLDLGKRNRVLNYKDTARSNVKIEYVSNVETNKNNSDLQKALRNLRNKAKTAIEEQGVNVLYLSFGFLKWTESENSMW